MQVARLRSGIVSPVSGRGAHAKPLLAARQGRNPSASAAGNLWHPKTRVKAIIENFVRIPVKIVYSLSPIQFFGGFAEGRAWLPAFRVPRQNHQKIGSAK